MINGGWLTNAARDSRPGEELSVPLPRPDQTLIVAGLHARALFNIDSFIEECCDTAGEPLGEIAESVWGLLRDRDLGCGDSFASKLGR